MPLVSNRHRPQAAQLLTAAPSCFFPSGFRHLIDAVHLRVGSARRRGSPLRAEPSAKNVF
jgi:hypothetical protein